METAKNKPTSSATVLELPEEGRDSEPERISARIELANTFLSVPPRGEYDDWDKTGLPRWLAFNFPRPTRRQLGRVLRCLVVCWTMLLIALYNPNVMSLMLAGLIVAIEKPNTSVFNTLFMIIFVFFGIFFGMCFFWLGLLWLSLFNSSAEGANSEPYIRVVIMEVWIIVVVWFFSSVQFLHASDPLGGLAFGAVMTCLAFVLGGEQLLYVPFVDVGGSIKGLLPFAVGSAVCFGAALLVIPEHDCEGTRESAFRVIRDLCEIFAGPREDNEGRFLLSRLRHNIADLVKDTKGCMTDIGLLYDVPARMVRFSEALQGLARHADPEVQSDLLVRVLRQIQDSLIVERKWWQLWRLIYAQPDPVAPAGVPLESLKEEIDGRLRQIAVLPPPDRIDRATLALFTEQAALEASMELLDETRAMLASRRVRLYAFGTPGKGIIDNKSKSVGTITPPSHKTKERRKWHLGRLVSNMLYGWHVAVNSDAFKFGFKRAFAFLVGSVWAFLPQSATAVEVYHLYWILITMVVLMTPTVGSGLAKTLVRLLVTGLGVFWAYLSFLAGRGLDYASRVRIDLAFFVPVSIVSYYLAEATTRHTYAGLLFPLTFLVISFGGTPTSSDEYGVDRAIWICVGVCGFLVLQVLVFPILAATDVRVTHANVIYTTARTLRAAHFGTEEDRDALDSKLAEAQHQLTVCRQGSLIDAADEPSLDRPWDYKLAVAISETTQRLLGAAVVILTSSKKLGNRAREKKGDELVETVLWKLHTIAMGLLSKKPLSVLPRLRNQEYSGNLLNGLAAQDRVTYAGGVAAWSMAMEEADMLGDLVTMVYGQESMPAEVSAARIDGAWKWGGEGSFGVLETKGIRGTDRAVVFG